jgi:hypothetical protein
MEVYMHLVFPIIGTSILLAFAGYSFELIVRKYTELKELSRSKTSTFFWLQHGWPIVSGMLNINIGVLLFLGNIILAFRLFDIAQVESIWQSILITIWFIMIFLTAMKASAEKKWKLF